MKVDLAYGEGWLPVEFPDEQTTIIEPSHTPGLGEEKKAVFQSLDQPIGTRPLSDWIKPSDRVCILFTDITRATPNERLIPWLLEYLHDVPRENILLLNQLGTHRPNTREELEQMLTPEVVERYEVINHEPENPEAHIRVGTMRDGRPALINRHVVEADVRIVTGFIEPHFFAGFSGGPKGIMPGCASLETVMSSHGAANIGHPNATFGVTHGNQLWEEIRDTALQVGPSFLLNVSLNDEKAITGVFAGDLLKAHEVGCEFVRKSAMQKVKSPYEIVVTTNSGYPLDQNLYQAVKGMSAGARIVQEGGLLILASECREGVPPDSYHDRLLRKASSPDEILKKIASPGFSHPEQWEAQIQALVQRKAEVQVYSSLSDEILKGAHLTPCRNITETVSERLKRLGPEARVAVLPQGPLTIPYLA